MTDQILVCNQLSISRNKDEILQDITFNVGRGEIIVLLGANGSGKSTLLKTIAGLLAYQKGSILLENQDLVSINRKKISQSISYTAQNNDFDLSYNVFEFIAFGRYPFQGIFPLLSQEDNQKIENALAITNLSPIAKKQISKLSGGEQQRALLARAIATDAPLMLLDEPSASLDIKHQLEFFNILKIIKKQGKGFIIAIHDINEAMALADKIILIHNKKIIFNGLASDSKLQSSIEETYQVKTIQKTKFDFELKT